MNTRQAMRVDNCMKYGCMVLVAPILLGLIWILIQLTGGIVFGHTDQYPAEIDRYEIVSLKDNSIIEGKVSGAFILGFGSVSGSINEKTKYFFYKKSGDTYSLSNLSTESTIIVEDENDHPYVSIKQAKYVKKGLGYIATTTQKFPDEIHVPKGTVKKEFNLDTEF